jgi:TolA-binding protein
MKSTLLILLSFWGFSSLTQAAISKAPVSQKSQVTTEQSVSNLRKSESDRNFQRDREMLLRKKGELEGRTVQALPTDTEKKIYEEMVQASERNDELSFQSRFQRMMMDYPNGVYADEALYLAGSMAFSNKLYGRALRHFDQIVKEYPRSNRSRAALYAKAAAYRKMNLRPQAVAVFQQVKRQYPGSPEARRADVDLKVIR